LPLLQIFLHLNTIQQDFLTFCRKVRIFRRNPFPAAYKSAPAAQNAAGALLTMQNFPAVKISMEAPTAARYAPLLNLPRAPEAQGNL